MVFGLPAKAGAAQKTSPITPSTTTDGASHNPKRFIVATPLLSRPSFREGDDQLRNLSVGRPCPEPILDLEFHAVPFQAARRQWLSRIAFNERAGGQAIHGPVDPDGRALGLYEKPFPRSRQQAINLGRLAWLHLWGCRERA